MTARGSHAQADVEIFGKSACLETGPLKDRVQALLLSYKPEGASELLVRIDVQDLVDGQSSIELIVRLPEGSLALQRDYQLASSDCASAEELLATVIAEFLEALPVKSWSALPVALSVPKAPPPPEALVAVDAASWQERGRLALVLGAMSGLAADSSKGRELWMPEAELGLGLAFERGYQAVSLGALARGSAAQDLGSGRFRPTSLLGQLSWQRGETIALGLRLRGGAVRVAGSGFDQNFAQWLPWASAGALVGYRWRSLQLIAQLFASPLRHDISIENRDDSLWLPRFRLGLGIEYSLGSKKL